MAGGNTNLLSWIVWGLAFQLLSAILILRHFCALGILGRMSKSLTATLHSLDGEALAAPSPYFISPPPGHSSSSNPSGFLFNAHRLLYHSTLHISVKQLFLPARPTQGAPGRGWVPRATRCSPRRGGGAMPLTPDGPNPGKDSISYSIS